jgi:hypothetical protein
MEQSSFSNVERIGSVYGTNGLPTAASEFEVSLAVPGFDHKIRVQLACAFFRIQAQSGGWAEEEIDGWERNKVFKYALQQVNNNSVSQSCPLTMPSSILFVGYQPKG